MSAAAVFMILENGRRMNQMLAEQVQRTTQNIKDRRTKREQQNPSLTASTTKVTITERK